MPRLVLIADGSPSHQRRAQGILTGEGLEVLTVSNGVAAIKKLPTIKPSLILADVSMPGRDGYEVCDFVKNSPDLTRVPVLLSYSDQAPYDESRAQRVRADGRIKKPFGQDELLGAVNRFLPQEEAAAAPSPVRAPIAVAPEPSLVSEPVDLPPEETGRMEMPDLGALSEGPAFGEQAMTDESPELSAPPISIEEAFSRNAEAEAPPERPSVDFAAMGGSAVVEEPQPPAEPMLVEEPAAAAADEDEEEPAARTMMFRMPVQIAEPILADDMAAPAPAQEPPPPSAPDPVASETEIAASTLESYSLNDAAAGQVSFARPTPDEATPPAVEEPAAETPAASAEAAAPPAQEPAAAAAVLDTELVHWIVHNVVVRMAPPALSTSHVEELIRQITDEMINELSQPAPEV